jgi:hypothetical protein
MYITTASRRELLDIVQRTYPGEVSNLRNGETGPDLRDSELSLIWRDEMQERSHTLPSLVAIPRDFQKDFFAWTYTYLSSLRPFTAFVRVVDSNLLATIEKGNIVRNLGRLGEAFVALIIGEAAGYVEPRLDIRQLTSTACANTHSSALTRAVALGFDDHLKEVSASWQLVGELTKQSRRNLDANTLNAPFEVLHELYTDEQHLGNRFSSPLNHVSSACREIVREGDIQKHTWRELTSSFGSISELREQMQESRENRVRTFEKARDWFTTNPQGDPILRGFVCGYLGSRIAPGDLDHLHLVATMSPIAQTAALWFSLCSGLQSRGQILAFGEGLGRRILRDIEQSDDVFGRPRCDLGVNELRILSGREKALIDFKTASSGLLTVELIPCVNTSVRWQRIAEVQSDLFGGRDVTVETRELVRDLSKALDRVEVIRRQLARNVDLDPDSSPRRGYKGTRRD